MYKRQASGYVSEDDPGKIPDSVQHLIDGTVAADRDQGQAFPAGGDIPGQLGGVQMCIRDRVMVPLSAIEKIPSIGIKK